MSTLERNQAARRRRVMDAALELAARGGFDAVQMRDVAALANVAVGTLYRYFPSKEYLLVSVLQEFIRVHADDLRVHPAAGETAAERVMDVLHRVVPRHPERNVFSAMVRALALSDPGVAAIVGDIGDTMTQALTGAMHDGMPSEREVATARILQQVWLAASIAWLGGVEGPDRIETDLETAVSLLIAESRVVG